MCAGALAGLAACADQGTRSLAPDNLQPSDGLSATTNASLISKHLADVFTMSADGRDMITDPIWAAEGRVSIPVGQTRWLEYLVDYSLPPGVTGKITENKITVCNSLGGVVNRPGQGGLECGFNIEQPVPMDVFVWDNLTGSGSIPVIIDIGAYGECPAPRSFTNTAVLTTSNGITETATTTTTITFVGANCSPPSGGVCIPANPFFGLGAAGEFAVLGLRGADVRISEGKTVVAGNVGLGANDIGSLLKATIRGTLKLDPSARPDIHSDLTVTGGRSTASLEAATNAAVAASARLAALPATQTYGAIVGSTTFVGNGGLNVINVGSINEVKSVLTLRGTASDVFVINVAGDFDFGSSQMVLQGGVRPSNVVFNFPTSGPDISIYKDITVAYGTFLAPQRKIVVDHATVTGSVIGGPRIAIHSAATVKCP
jgi:choice-of-anchor A domain-containing protein